MQIGPLSFFVTLLFKPKVLTAYTSGQVLFLDPLASAQATIAAMLLAGLLCIFALPRLHGKAIQGISITFVILPALIGFAVLNLYLPAIPFLASTTLGITCIAQIYFFARNNHLGTSETLLSAGIGLAAALSLSHLAFIMTEVHMYGTAILATLSVISGSLIFRQQKDQGTRAQTAIDDRTGIRATLRGSLAPGLPILLESLLVALTVGSSWNRAEFDALGSNSPLFLIGTLLGLGFVLVLFRMWLKSSSADFLVYGAAFPVTIAILLNVIGGNTPPPIYLIAVLSEFCFLVLVWSSVLLLDKSPVLAGVLTIFYLLVFVVAFGFFMSLSSIVPTSLSQKSTGVLAILFLLYLLYYALHKSNTITQDNSNASDKDNASINELLSSGCSLLASKYGLSARETELLPFFVVGMSSTEIGRRMFISPETVKTHRKRVYGKLNVGSHQELYDTFIEMTKHCGHTAQSVKR